MGDNSHIVCRRVCNDRITVDLDKKMTETDFSKVRQLIQGIV